MRRAVVIVLSVVLALAVAAPIATAQRSKTPQLASLTGSWWSWIAQTESSPVEGSYSGGDQCEGEFVDGVFFLAGTTFTDQDAERTCTVPADTPILFPVFNALCSEAWTNPPDPTPYTECATGIVDAAGTDMFATLQKTGEEAEALDIRRIASGPFTWTIGKGFDANTDNDGSLFKKGRYAAATDGYWVYLQKGLKPGTYTLNFGGSFFGGAFDPDVTYTLKVE